MFILGDYAFGLYGARLGRMNTMPDPLLFMWKLRRTQKTEVLPMANNNLSGRSYVKNGPSVCISAHEYGVLHAFQMHSV